MMYAADGVGLAAPQVRRERERVCLLSVCAALSPSKLLDMRRFDIEVECLCVVDMKGSDRRRFNAIISGGIKAKISPLV